MSDAEKIENRMKELGLTRIDLAKEISVATPIMCQKINNIRPFSLDEAEKLATVLKINDKDFGTYFFHY